MSTQWEIRLGNCIEAMATMEEGSIDAIVTDPPYGLSFMGQSWDTFDPATLPARVGKRNGAGPPSDSRDGRSKGRTASAFANPGGEAGAYDFSATAQRRFQAWCEAWAREALRVLKPGGHMVVSGSPRTYHRMAAGIEDAGFEIRDTIAWMYGTGFPKSLNLDGPHAGWGTALKPAHEPIVVARKPLDGTVAANVESYGTGALNIDGCRVDFQGANDQASAKPGGRATAAANGAVPNVAGVERVEFDAIQGDGRWPANVALDEDAARMLDEQSGETTSSVDRVLRRGVTTGAGMGYGSSSPSQAADIGCSDTGGASRFFYCAKASSSERSAGLHGDRNDHPTVKPIDLMRWLVRLVTPPEGLVLDPFMGSGTTGIAALREGFSFIGLEREPRYVEIARARIIGDAPLLNAATEATA